MVLSGNRKTAYYHALFIYNQLVTQSVANVAKIEKHFRTITILHHHYCSPFCLLFLFAILPKALIESR